jgi:hypothetical protein
MTRIRMCAIAVSIFMRSSGRMMISLARMIITPAIRSHCRLVIRYLLVHAGMRLCLVLLNMLSRRRSTGNNSIWNFLNCELMLRWVWICRRLSLVSSDIRVTNDTNPGRRRALLLHCEKASCFWRWRRSIFLHNFDLMCRYNHFLTSAYDTRVCRRYFHNIAFRIAIEIDEGWSCLLRVAALRRDLLRGLSRNKSDVFELYPLHSTWACCSSRNCRLSHCHPSSRQVRGWMSPYLARISWVRRMVRG